MRLIVASLAIALVGLAAQAAPPTIYFQPESLTNLAGEDAVFVVDAAGENDLSYQWRKNGAAMSDSDRISGATDLFLQINGVTANDMGNYSVTVKDVVTGQTVTSSNAYLKVLVPPTIPATGHPVSKAVVAGSNVTFTVKATGTAPLGYQWLLDGVEIPGGTAASLTLPQVRPADEGDYTVVVTNEAVLFGADAASSEPATLTVLIPPTVTDQPESVVAVEGDSVSFSVEAEGTDTDEHSMTYQWRKNGVNLSYETEPILSLSDITASQAGNYTVKIMNAAGSVISSNATLTVYAPPKITTQPASKVIKAGDTATFTVKAAGTAPLGYQWFFNDEKLPNRTNSTLTFMVTDRNQAGAYSVAVSNAAALFDEDNIALSGDGVLTVQDETVKPTVTVTKPLEGARWSNAVVNVEGKATDNVVVSDVLWRVNGGGWQGAANLSKTASTAWSALSVPLQPGTNLFRAQSIDTSGNKSAYADRHIFYVVPSLFTLLTNGLGTVTLNPAVKSNMLEIGRGYTLTATPALGFGFVRWDGGITSTNRILNFLMSSNLILRANFKDITKPTVTISSPPANARLSNAVVTFQGTAKDNLSLDRVEYRLNNGAFESAIGTSNWSATVNLTAGTNVFQVKSIDTTTNESLVAARSVFFVVPSPLTLLTNGNGRITGATNGQLLEVGRGYKLTATPALRHLFAEWTGDVWSTNPALTFLMQSNMTLRANFVTNPFVGLKGTYYGLFAETNEVRNHDRSGSFTITLAEAGTYSASFQLGAKKLSATGKFDWLGRSWLNLKPSPTTNVLVALQLDVTNLSAKVVGVVGNEFWMSPLFGIRPAANLGTNSSPQAGKYTAVLLHTVDSPTVPGGDGYGTISLTASGLVQFTGMMADGTPVTQTTGVSADGQWPFYANLYSGKGSVLGWGAFTNRGTSSIEGGVSWIKMPVPGKFYPNGFTTEVQILGSHYAQPPRGVRVLNVATGEVIFAEGNLTAVLTNGVFLTTNNTVTVTSGTNRLALTFTLSTGTASGTFIHPATRLYSRIYGVLLPEDNTMSGFFLGTNRSGAVIMHSPSP